MDVNRRGFLSTLAGALLGAAVIGPKALAAAPAELWKAAPKLPPMPVANQFVPLEAFTAEVLRIVNENLKWLRLRQVCSEDWYRPMRLGDTVRVREPFSFEPMVELWPRPWDDKIRHVPLLHQTACHLRLDALDLRRPWGKVEKCHAEPAAYALADKIIDSVRRQGGAEYLIAAEQQIPEGVPKTALVTAPDAGLSLRAVEYVDYGPVDESKAIMDRPKRVLRLDMLYGLG